jgi:type II secretory pathway component GspD/PulD (secretin)
MSGSSERNGIPDLFLQTSTQEEKKDLLILITPHVLDEGEVVRPPSPRR